MVRLTLLNKEMADVPVPVVITGVKYGLLYNWYAATDVRNICAEGWNIPSKTEFTIICDYLAGYEIAGGKLKETGLIYWNTPNSGATNEVNFNAVGAGRRNQLGTFIEIKAHNYLHLSTIYSSYYGMYVRLDYGSTVVTGIGGDGIAVKKMGFSIRPVRPATELEQLQMDGEACAPYTGNDGKVYTTVKIGTQVWVAANLAETKYRNGDTITEVTDNAAWAALTTGALCAYDNDWSNVLL